jgi:GntR family transcriptional regulator, carbon starvation induced regulator
VSDIQIDTSDSETLAQVAYRALRHDIINGLRVPGERLRIGKLKTIYGIGPTPLREALQKLSQDALVLAEDNRGFIVAHLDPLEFVELNIARTAIEKECLRLSLTRGDDRWESQVVAASYIMKKEDAALSSSKDKVPDSWERANVEFHTALVSACGSRWLLRIRTQLHDLCERYRRVAVYQKMATRDVAAEHAAIAAAALNRDIDLICDLMEQHFAKTAEAFLTAPSQPQR